MSMDFWSTVGWQREDMRYAFRKYSGEHAISLISPNARGIVERSEGVCLYSKRSNVGSRSGRVCQLRVDESPNTAQRFLSCPSDWEMRISDVACTGRCSTLTMRQFAVLGIDPPPCFDWWINRRTSSLPLSLVIKANKERVHLPADRYGDSLVSLTLDGRNALQNIQICWPLASVRTLRLDGISEVIAHNLLPFPNLGRLYVTKGPQRFMETRVDFRAVGKFQGSNARFPCEHLQHLLINECSHVCLPEMLMVSSHFQSLSLRGSRLESPLHFPPAMPLLNHLDLRVWNPELIRQLPHCQNLRFLALQDLDFAILGTILNGGKYLRHLEARINNVESFDISDWEPFMDVLEVLHIQDSPQLRNLAFSISTCGRLLHLSSLNVNGNSQLRTLDTCGCVNLTELDCCHCPQLREVVGLVGLKKLRKAHVYHNPKLKTLDVSGCSSLREFFCQVCTVLEGVAGLARLGELETLHTHENPKLTSIDVSGCVSLTDLFVDNCRELQNVVGVAGLKKLERLFTHENPKLTSLDVSGCVSLNDLRCHGCPKLRNLVGLDDNPALNKSVYKKIAHDLGWRSPLR